MINVSRLKEIREDNDITQMQMSHILKVKRSTYSLWELGISIIPINYLYNFAKFFNVTIDYCLGLTNKRVYVSYQPFDLQVIAYHLKRLRKENKLSQVQLAKQFGISQACIAKYEKGSIYISVSCLYKYSKYFHVTFDQLCRTKEILVYR